MRRRAAIVTATVLALASIAGCGDEASQVTSDSDDVTTREATLTYAGDVDLDELEEATRMRLAGYEIEAIDVSEPNRLRVVLAEDSSTVDEAVASLATRGVLRFRPVLSTAPGLAGDLTTPEDDRPDLPVVLGERDDAGDVVSTYELGPSLLDGAAVESAEAALESTGQWAVRLVIGEGEGVERFNAATALCSARAPACPAGQLAMAVDGEVLSAPTISQPSYERDQIQITGNMTEAEAKRLARALAAGALPVELELDTITTAGP